GAGQHPVSRNAFCRVADCSASRVSPAFPDRRDLSWSTAGRSPASAQRVFRTRVVLHATNLEETFVGVLRRGRRRTGARPGGLSAPRFRVRVAHGAVVDHLQDSTHTSFGVLTTGLVVDRFKLEGSAFNGREPDEKRYSIQFAPLDSWSARLSAAPSRNWTAQYSYGRLEHPEALEPGSQRRQTASVEYVRPFAKGSWATSVVWGRVHKEVSDHNLNGYLLETTANFKLRNYAFSRMELVDK